MLATESSGLTGAAPAMAAVGEQDAVLDWNEYAAQALINTPAATPPGAGQPPPVSVLHLAMVQGAVYDAVNSIDRRHEPYLGGLPAAPAWGSKAAAVATAAHDVLVGVNVVPPLSPTIVQRLDGLLGQSLAAATVHDGSAAVAAGIAAGAAAADAMLAERANDGRYGSFRFTVGSGIGVWRPTPPGLVNDPNAWIARVDPFAMKSPSQFRSPGPRRVGSAAYRAEYSEAKSLGGNGTTTPTNRTAEQTAVAQFFTANPVEMFNRTFRSVAASEGLTLSEQARLFAMLNLSGADAAIACWDDKAYWSFWRPITAIREDDGDPLTDADPAWTSLIAAPPYPDHPSGYNCQTGAFMNAAKAVFGNIGFAMTANLASGPVTRNYKRFTDVIDDTIDARVWLGIHFRSADVDGAWIGKRAANWLGGHHLRPRGQ